MCFLLLAYDTGGIHFPNLHRDDNITFSNTINSSAPHPTYIFIPQYRSIIDIILRRLVLSIYNTNSYNSTTFQYDRFRGPSSYTITLLSRLFPITSSKYLEENFSIILRFIDVRCWHNSVLCLIFVNRLAVSQLSASFIIVSKHHLLFYIGIANTRNLLVLEYNISHLFHFNNNLVLFPEILCQHD